MDPLSIVSSVCAITSTISAVLTSFYGFGTAEQEWVATAQALAGEQIGLPPALKALRLNASTNARGWGGLNNGSSMKELRPELAVRLQEFESGLQRLLEGVRSPSSTVVAAAILVFAVSAGTTVSIERRRRPGYERHVITGMASGAMLAALMGYGMKEISFAVLPWLFITITWILRLVSPRQARNPAELRTHPSWDDAPFSNTLGKGDLEMSSPSMLFEKFSTLNYDPSSESYKEPDRLPGLRDSHR